MARKKRQPIAPFPADIDRDAFWHWLSGFTDGEGCFYIYHRRGRKRQTYHCFFTIKLRSDDSDILFLIQSYFKCGIIRHCGVIDKRSHIKANPVTEFSVYRIGDIVNTVVPNFKQHPLRAKKSRDFAIWCDAVTICARLKQQYDRSIRIGDIRLGRSSSTPEQRSELHRIKQLLESTKCYNPNWCQLESDSNNHQDNFDSNNQRMFFD